MSTENRPQFKLNVGPEYFSVSNSEQVEALEWYREQLNNLPEMKVESFPVTGAGGWEAKLTPEAEVEAVTGRHFTIEGRRVTTPTFLWNQPIIVQRSEEFINKVGETDKISGIVLLLTDPRDRIFVSVVQEPGIQAQAVEGKKSTQLFVRHFKEALRSFSN